MGLVSWWRERGAEVVRQREQKLLAEVQRVIADREAGKPDAEGGFVDRMKTELTPDELYWVLILAGTSPLRAEALIATR